MRCYSTTNSQSTALRISKMISSFGTCSTETQNLRKQKLLAALRVRLEIIPKLPRRKSLRRKPIALRRRVFPHDQPQQNEHRALNANHPQKQANQLQNDWLRKRARRLPSDRL